MYMLHVNTFHQSQFEFQLQRTPGQNTSPTSMEDKDIRLTNMSRDFLILLNSSHHVTTLSMRYMTRVAHVGSKSPSFTSKGYML